MFPNFVNIFLTFAKIFVKISLKTKFFRKLSQKQTFSRKLSQKLSRKQKIFRKRNFANFSRKFNNFRLMFALRENDKNIFAQTLAQRMLKICVWQKIVFGKTFFQIEAGILFLIFHNHLTLFKKKFVLYICFLQFKKLQFEKGEKYHKI